MMRTKTQSNRAKPQSSLQSNRKRKLDMVKNEGGTDKPKEPKNDVEPRKKFAVYANKSMKLFKSWNPPLKKRNCLIKMNDLAGTANEHVQPSTLEKKAESKKLWKPPQPIVTGIEKRILTESKKATEPAEAINLFKIGDRSAGDESAHKNVSLEVPSCSDEFYRMDEIREGKRIDDLEASNLWEKLAQTTEANLRTVQESGVKDLASGNGVDGQLQGNHLKLDTLNLPIDNSESSLGNGVNTSLKPVSNDMRENEVMASSSLEKSAQAAEVNLRTAQERNAKDSPTETGLDHQPRSNHSRLETSNPPGIKNENSQGNEAKIPLMLVSRDISKDENVESLLNQESLLKSNRNHGKPFISNYQGKSGLKSQHEEQEARQNLISAGIDKYTDTPKDNVSNKKSDKPLTSDDTKLNTSTSPTMKVLECHDDEQGIQRNIIRYGHSGSQNENIKQLSITEARQPLDEHDAKLTTSILPTVMVLEHQDNEQEIQRNLIGHRRNPSQNEDVKNLSDTEARQQYDGPDAKLTDSNFPTEIGFRGQNEKQANQSEMILNSNDTKTEKNTDYFADTELHENDRNQPVRNIPTAACQFPSNDKHEKKRSLVTNSINAIEDEVSLHPTDNESNQEFDSNNQSQSVLVALSENTAEFGNSDEKYLAETQTAADNSSETTAKKHEKELKEQEMQSFKVISEEEEQSSDDDLDKIVSKTIEKHLREGEMRLKRKLQGGDQTDTDDESSLETVILTPENHQETTAGLKGRSYSFKAGYTSSDDSVMLTPEKHEKSEDFLGHLTPSCETENHLSATKYFRKNYQETKIGLESCSCSFKAGNRSLDETIMLTPGKYKKSDDFVGHLTPAYAKENNLEAKYSLTLKVYPESKTDFEGTKITKDFMLPENTTYSIGAVDESNQEEKKDSVNSSFLAVEKSFDFKSARVPSKSKESNNFNPAEQYHRRGNNFAEVGGGSQFLRTEKGTEKRDIKVSADEYISAFNKTDETDLFFGLDDNDFPSLKPSSLSNAPWVQNGNNACGAKEGDTPLDFRDRNLKDSKNCNQDYAAEISSSSKDVHVSNIQGKMNETKFHSFNELCKSVSFDKEPSKLSQEYEAMVNFVDNTVKKNISPANLGLKFPNCHRPPQRMRKNVEFSKRQLILESLYEMNFSHGQQQRAASDNFLAEEFVKGERFPYGQHASKSFACQQFDGAIKPDFVSNSFENKILPFEPNKTFSMTNDGDPAFPRLRDEHSPRRPDLVISEESAQPEKSETVINQLKSFDRYLDTRNKNIEGRIDNIEDIVSQTRSLVNALVRRMK